MYNLKLMQGHLNLGEFETIDDCNKEILSYCSLNYPNRDIDVVKDKDGLNVRVALSVKENEVRKAVRSFLRLPAPVLPVQRLLFNIKAVS